MAVSLPLPYKEDVERWTVEQVTAWLQQREMPEVADIYLRKGIDGHQMLNIPKPKQVAMFWDLSIRERTDVLNIIDQIKNQPTVPLRKSHPARIPSQSQKLLPITKHVQPLGPLQKTLPVPPNRVASANISSSVLEVTSEEPDNKIVPFIDEDANEDYLVPLSAGVIGVISHAPPLLLRNKKDRCPSPSQNAKDNTSNIQSKELPEPPSLRSPSVPYSVESSMKFNSYSTTILQDDENDREERSEQNKEDLNAYEIIHENPNKQAINPQIFQIEMSFLQ